MAGTYNYDWRKSSLITAPKPVTPKKDKLVREQQKKPMGGYKPGQTPVSKGNAPKPKPKVNKPNLGYKGGGFKPGKTPVSAGNGPKSSNQNPKPGNQQGQGQSPMSIDQWLGGDTVYNDQMSLFQKIYEDYMLSNNRMRGDVEEDYGLALKRMGKERDRSLRDMAGDYGSRGLINSGLYGRDVSEYNTDYQDTVNELSIDKNRALEDLIETLGMFGTSLDAQKVAARQEALRRYAERFASMPDGMPAPNDSVDPTDSGGSVYPNNDPRTRPMGPDGGRKTNQPAQDPLQAFTGNLKDYPRIRDLALKKDWGAGKIRDKLGPLTPAQRTAMRKAIELNKRRDN